MNLLPVLVAVILSGSLDTASGAGTFVVESTPDTLTMPLQGREAVEALTFLPLSFDPPYASERDVLGVTVFHLHDPSLPLVDLHVQIRGGPSHLSRTDLAAATALPTMLRVGGTTNLPPDSVDRRLDLLALELGFVGGGEGTTIGMNALTQTLDEGLALLRQILLQPAFDVEALEVWRGQELERIRRREDNPTGLAYSEFNRLMFGDHPVGWVLSEEDLSPDRLDREDLQRIHSQHFCREHLVLGVSGDLEWDAAETKIREFVEPWPECEATLTSPPSPDLLREGGVYVLPKDVDQTTIILAGPGGLRQEDTPEYFASRLANHILGGGGFSSRLMARVRTEEGLAYGASSVWTTPNRHEGIVGAVTATRTDRTLAATRILLDVLNELRVAPPTQEEVDRALDEFVNGYVFAFETSSQIVARQMAYRAQGLPDDWLERYIEGLQGVTPEAIHHVVQQYVDPDRMTILLVGNVSGFDPGLEAFETVFELSTDGQSEPWINVPSDPGGLRRFPP